MPTVRSKPKKPSKKTVTRTPAVKPKKPSGKGRLKPEDRKRTSTLNGTTIRPVNAWNLAAMPPRPREQKFRCESCIKLTPESDLKMMWGELRCSKCRVFWYAVAVVPDVHEEDAARDIRHAMRTRGIPGEVLVPRHLVGEYTKTSWRVWRNEKAMKEAWKIPESEKDRDVLREHFGLLGIVTADDVEQAKDYARYKFPNEFDRVVEAHSPGGKPKLVARVKFEGYILVRCEYTDDMHHIMHGTSEKRGGLKTSLGMLPICPNPYNGFRYPRKEPKQRRKPQLWELEAQDEWQPCALDTKEEVEALLEEKLKIKNTPRKLECRFPVGSEVKIVNGQWQDVRGKVESHTADMKFVVAFEVFGRKVRTAPLDGWQLVPQEN